MTMNFLGIVWVLLEVWMAMPGMHLLPHALFRIFLLINRSSKPLIPCSEGTHRQVEIWSKSFYLWCLYLYPPSLILGLVLTEVFIFGSIFRLMIRYIILVSMFKVVDSMAKVVRSYLLL